MKTIFITGCANGIGKFLAQKLLALNYQIIATDIDYESLESIQWNSDKIFLQKLDVSKADDWKNIINWALTKVEKIDILINNAGVIKPSFVSDLETKDVDFQIDVNLKGVIYGTKFVSDVMLKQGFGHIINLASLAGVAPIEGLPIYSASKFGVRGFSIAAAYELKRKGIDVSVVCPDLVDTNMLTLQLDYESANMTFSGDKILSVEEIFEAIYKRGIIKKELEIMIPKSRGILAKIGNFFPKTGGFLSEIFTKKGNKRRLELVSMKK